MVGIPGDGTQWGINSIQFIREKMLGSDAFYSLNIHPAADFSIYILVVYMYTRTHMYIRAPAYIHVYILYRLFHWQWGTKPLV